MAKSMVYGDREARTAAPVVLSAPAGRQAFKISAGRPGPAYIFKADNLTASLHIYKACIYQSLQKHMPSCMSLCRPAYTFEICIRLRGRPDLDSEA